MIPTSTQVRDFLDNIKYPRFAAFAVNKLVAKFNLTHEEAIVLWQNYWEENDA